MKDIELQDIWKAYDQKLEESRILNMQSWVLNLQSFTMMQSFKAQDRLRRLSGFKIRVIVFGLPWVCFLGFLVSSVPFHINPYFSISAIIVLAINISSIGGYIYHIVLISQVNYEGTITDTQQKLASLQTSTLSVIRIAWLQMPFYTTWFWHPVWVDFADPYFLGSAVSVTLLFTWLTVYLYRNTTPQNMHKKWIKLLVGNSPEYTAVLKAREFISDIDNFKRNL
jgi:hypothetical protein